MEKHDGETIAFSSRGPLNLIKVMKKTKKKRIQKLPEQQKEKRFLYKVFRIKITCNSLKDEFDNKYV